MPLQTLCATGISSSLFAFLIGWHLSGFIVSQQTVYRSKKKKSFIAKPSVKKLCDEVANNSSCRSLIECEKFFCGHRQAESLFENAQSIRVYLLFGLIFRRRFSEFFQNFVAASCNWEVIESLLGYLCCLFPNRFIIWRRHFLKSLIFWLLMLAFLVVWYCCKTLFWEFVLRLCFSSCNWISDVLKGRRGNS